MNVLQKLAYLLAQEYPTKGRITPPGTVDAADAVDSERREKSKTKLDTEKLTDKLETTVSDKLYRQSLKAKKNALMKHRLFWLSDRGRLGEKGIEKDFSPFPAGKESQNEKG